jgi:hypothetical protein
MTKPSEELLFPNLESAIDLYEKTTDHVSRRYAQAEQAQLNAASRFNTCETECLARLLCSASIPAG